MRLMEGLRLRIKDVDFDRHAIIVRETKGNKDRVVAPPPTLHTEISSRTPSASISLPLPALTTSPRDITA